eukprot:SAG11_NODE_9152_length_938_cov_1.011919_1_plen_87_part_00
MLTDILSCQPGFRAAMCAGFSTGFNASQVMQGESTAVDALRVASFLGDHPDAAWFMDHYMLDTAGAQRDSEKDTFCRKPTRFSDLA